MTDRQINGLIEHNENLNKQIKSFLQDALILLLEKKNLEDISITEICTRAGVSRMAFYSNYKSKTDLYEEIVRSLNKDMVEVVGMPFSKTTNLDWYLNFFLLMQENANAVNIVFRADKQRYLSAINAVVLYTRPLSEEQKYLRLIWTGGMVNAMYYWMDSGMSKSVEEIAALCYNSLNSVLSACPAQ